MLFGEQSRFMAIFYAILVRAIYLVFLQPKTNVKIYQTKIYLI